MTRCPECRTRRQDNHLMFLHTQRCPRPLCRCGGYPYTHRPGSPCCDAHPRAALNRAARGGADDLELLDIAAGVAWGGRGEVSSVCPF